MAGPKINPGSTAPIFDAPPIMLYGSMLSPKVNLNNKSENALVYLKYKHKKKTKRNHLWHPFRGDKTSGFNHG